MLILAL
jgi:pre-mRNA-processing factor 8